MPVREQLTATCKFSGYNQAPRNTAVKIALNQQVQVVAPAMHKAFRLADLHNNI